MQKKTGIKSSNSRIREDIGASQRILIPLSKSALADKSAPSLSHSIIEGDKNPKYQHHFRDNNFPMELFTPHVWNNYFSNTSVPIITKNKHLLDKWLKKRTKDNLNPKELIYKSRNSNNNISHNYSLSQSYATKQQTSKKRIKLGVQFAGKILNSTSSHTAGKNGVCVFNNTSNSRKMSKIEELVKIRPNYVHTYIYI